MHFLKECPMKGEWHLLAYVEQAQREKEERAPKPLLYDGKIIAHVNPLENCLRFDTYHRLKSLPYDGLIFDTKLTSIVLDRHCLEELPEWFTSMTTLTQLHLDHNLFSSLPPLNIPSSLLHLSMSGNPAVHVDTDQLTMLSSLEILNMSGLLLNVLSPSVCRLRSLTILNACDLKMEEVPDAISSLVNLWHLRLSMNHLTTLPGTMSCLQALESIWIDHNELTHVPGFIVLLTSLSTLDMSFNRLITVPSALLQHATIEALDLAHNVLGDSLHMMEIQMPRLATLAINNNQLTRLPGVSQQSSKITRLNMNDNCLREMPASFFTPFLSSLRDIHIEHNKCWFVPPCLLLVPKMNHLTCSVGENLQRLPRDCTYRDHRPRIVLNAVANIVNVKDYLITLLLHMPYYMSYIEHVTGLVADSESIGHKIMGLCVARGLVFLALTRGYNMDFVLAQWLEQ